MHRTDKEIDVMRRWVFAATLMTLAFAFSASPSRAGWFSGGSLDCHDCGEVPSCAAPYAPECCAPAAPVCAAPQYVYQDCAPSGPVYCDGSCGQEKECGLKRGLRKLWHLEQRKNRCLKDTFFGWCDKDECRQDDCTPHYYYQPGCAAPHGCY